MGNEVLLTAARKRCERTNTELKNHCTWSSLLAQCFTGHRKLFTVHFLWGPLLVFTRYSMNTQNWVAYRQHNSLDGSALLCIIILLFCYISSLSPLHAWDGRLLGEAVVANQALHRHIDASLGQPPQSTRKRITGRPPTTGNWSKSVQMLTLL